MAVFLASGCDSPPEVTIDMPAAQESVAEVVRIECTATDDDSVTRVELWVDGDSTGLADDEEPFTFAWNTKEYTDRSSHALVARAYDVANQVGESDTVTVTVDNRRSYPQPLGITSTAFRSGRYTIVWDRSRDADFASYRVEKSSEPSMADSRVIFTSERVSDTSYVDRKIDPLQPQHYRVIVIDTLSFESEGPILTSPIYPPPKAIDIMSVTYDFEKMTVAWSSSPDGNFRDYQLLYAASPTGSKKSLARYSDRAVSEHVLDDFDPTKENWFWIRSTNSYDQTTTGKGASNEVDSPPPRIDVKTVKYDLKKMAVTWDKCQETDFESYELLYAQEETGPRTLYATITDADENSYRLTDYDPTHKNWFWVRTTDYWGQTSVGRGITNKVDSPPREIAVRSVKYTLDEMVVKWKRSKDKDFQNYEVLYSETEGGERVSLATIASRKKTSYTLTEFDPSHENWFWINVADRWGLESVGKGKSNKIDAPPQTVDITAVEYDDNSMTISWDQSTEPDFFSYTLLYSEMEDGPRRSLVTSRDSSRTSYVMRDFDPTHENWFWVKVSDKWGLTSTGMGKSNEVNFPPEPLDVTSVNYDLEKFVLKWERSAHPDFVSYDLLVSHTRQGRKRVIASFADREITLFSLVGQGKFDPSRERWFWIRTTDHWGQESFGRGYKVLDDNPTEPILAEVVYRNDSFYFTWTRNPDDDFKSYTLYQSSQADMSTEEEIFSSSVKSDTTFVLEDVGPWHTKYYRLEVQDVWGLTTSSVPVTGDSHSWFVKTYGGTDPERGQSVQQTEDGGFIVTGQTYASDKNGDVWLLKTDPKGREEWSRTFGGEGTDHGYSVQQTVDGGYIIAGFTEAYREKWSDVWVIKTDEHGNQQWNRTFGGFKWDKAHAIQQTRDGGYIILGYTFSFGSGDSDIWLIKTDRQGDREWNKTFGGSNWDYGYSVNETDDGGYIITGYTESFGRDWSDIWLIKTDSLGNGEWNRIFGNREYDYGHLVQQTLDGGYITVGVTRAFYPGFEDVWLIKTDREGREEWNRTFGGRSWDKCYAVDQTSDGGFVLTGSTQLMEDRGSDVWLIKTDSQGISQWKRLFDASDSDDVYSVHQTTDGGYVITGFTESAVEGASDLLLIKTDPGGNVPPDGK